MKQLICAIGLILFSGPLVADTAAIKAINALRADKGRPALAYSPRLEQAAKAHAQDMATGGFFSHTGSNGSSVGKRVKRQGYKWCYVGENIAYGQGSLSAALQGWVNSPGHYKNMINRKAREFGIARGKGNLWVMVLAAPC